MIRKLSTSTLSLLVTISLVSTLSAQEGSHKPEGSQKKEGSHTAAPAKASTTVKGEVVDLVCYIGAGDKGKVHAACAAKCISSGLPVGILDDDGEVYLLVNKKMPLNAVLAPMAGQQITVTGTEASRGGMRMLKNAKIEGVDAPAAMEGSHKHDGGHKHEGSHKH